MQIEHLRHSLKVKWLLYYRQHRPWLVQLRIWGTYDGQRRPASSFILATLSNLEPQLTQMFPFIVALSNDPDQIVAALGLNFNPDQELKSITKDKAVVETNTNGNGVKAPLSETNTNGNGLKEAPLSETNTNGNSSIQISKVAGEVSLVPVTQPSNLPSWVDEACTGKGNPNPGLVLSVLAVVGTVALVFIGFTG